jgi:hypothetical protein
MKKKIITILMIFVLGLGFVGCDKTKLPEGFENKSFYTDMIKCLQLTEKTLQTKNTKYIDNIDKLINNNMSKEKEFNNKEIDVLANIRTIRVNLEMYMNNYFDSINTDTKKIIDTDTFIGKILLKEIQKVISTMQLDYKISLE